MNVLLTGESCLDSVSFSWAYPLTGKHAIRQHPIRNTKNWFIFIGSKIIDITKMDLGRIAKVEIHIVSFSNGIAQVK